MYLLITKILVLKMPRNGYYYAKHHIQDMIFYFDQKNKRFALIGGIDVARS